MCDITKEQGPRMIHRYARRIHIRIWLALAYVRAQGHTRVRKVDALSYHHIYMIATMLYSRTTNMTCLCVCVAGTQMGARSRCAVATC